MDPKTPDPLNLLLVSYTELEYEDDDLREMCSAADLVIALGGVNLPRLAEMLPKVAGRGALCVLGPRDDRQIPAPFKALHANGVTYRGWRIAGFSGAPRIGLTEGFYVSEAEADNLLASLPACDLFLSHAPPLGLAGQSNGFASMSDYLATKPPIYHFHASPSETDAQEYHETLVCGVNGIFAPPPLVYS